MNIWEEQTKALTNKILEERARYLYEIGSDPNYVIIPIHYKALLVSENNYSINCLYDTYYGMQVIESRICRSISDVKVY